ncbi:MAG: hypothetical protein LBD37_04290 [Treponema sp.]|jgi:hypothetical protein|nr:hypothetical protein [Treponema sp.]
MRIRFLVVCFVSLMAALPAAAPLAAQEDDSKKSDFYYVNVLIEKIYPYQKGYVVVYRKGISQMARTYLPLEWFKGAGAKGEIIQIGSGTRWPCLTIFYKSGEFDHLRLYLRQDPNHASWGNIPVGTNLDSEFEGIEELKLEF